ncbi:hypothetical protein G6F23_012744 [Rhizopus arrhizus]|nr:hypothetical protein G6F23_012744 [Rhizopus arrhizus]
MSLLVMQGLSGGYAEVDIVSGIDMTVAANEIVTIAGTNGAGKSTLVKAVMGLLPRIAGTMAFDGRDLLALPVEERVRIGISYVPQVRNVFGALTVLENLQVVEHVQGREQRIRDMFELFPALAGRRKTHAENLSGGERQMLAVGRALMAKPRLLMLDEPSLGLAPRIVREVFRIVARLREMGVSILLIEQNARAALQVADYAYVLETGTVTLEGPAAQVAVDPRVVEVYLGLGHGAPAAAPA